MSTPPLATTRVCTDQRWLWLLSPAIQDYAYRALVWVHLPLQMAGTVLGVWMAATQSLPCCALMDHRAAAHNGKCTDTQFPP